MLLRMDAQYQLGDVSDDALLTNLKRFVAGSNQLTAIVLAHLAEVDARGAYRLWACPSLQAYCEYELRLSEDEAQRRCRAARVARQFPLLFEMLAEGSIHLTGILLLAPCLTAENHTHLLACARYRRKREIERLVAEIAPRPDVPARIEPLGSGSVPGAHSGSPSTWGAWAERRAVRELTPGDGPTAAPSAPPEWVATLAPAAMSDALPASAPAASTASPPDTLNLVGSPYTSGPAGTAVSHGSAPARNGMRYKVQFTADQAYVDLLEQARDLLSHQIPNRDLARVQQLALEALVEKLSRRKYAATNRPRRADPSPTQHPPVLNDPPSSLSSSGMHTNAAAFSAPEPADAGNDAPRSAPDRRSHGEAEQGIGDPAPIAGQVVSGERESTLESSRRETRTTHTRHLPAALRRAVWERDGARCTYVDARGVRCPETAKLEFHHEHAHALGGPASLANICLRCRPHNDLAAERDFGRSFMERKRRGESTQEAVTHGEGHG
jgi:5-methylcytosine-specific restriction endonuclease McrA